MGDLPEHLGVNEGWLERRFDLFEKICLPSIVRQTENSFQWLIFLDLATPEKFVKRMEKISSKYDFLVPVYCQDMREDFLIEEMNERSSPGKTRIMTRLDNDDAVDPHLVEEIQRMSRKHARSNNLEKGFFVSFPLGCTGFEGSYYIRRFQYNPFVSFVSLPTFKKTIFGWDHTRIAEVAPVFCKYTTPMWCQTIHGENIGNTVRGLYLPWGIGCNFTERVSGDSSRAFLWQCSEFWRSLTRYISRK